ncbi:hypothetical protein GCM10011403_20350 [Pseudohongiella nitratireducens]|uniref:Glycosyltransferase n=2 Tax=Pseudohongiella nitratireducens TaxID=1768907 RepID=A0A916QJK4_9GAMM|nr:hypothetical protein GCM10011403_20350 [Pseudohongiella nitratireducens]
MADQAQKSTLSDFYRVVNLPNPIDVSKFVPISKDQARRGLGIPLNKKVILFGAMSVVDKRKGFAQLCQAIRSLSEKDIEVVVFGATDSDLSETLNQKVRLMGNISSDDKLIELYSAADVMVVPSLQENLSNAIMESMSCSLPVVGFDIGGNSDMIDHKVNGYLARPMDTEDLANGMLFVLSQLENSKLSAAAREKIVSKFSYKVVSRQYLQLFQSIL